jgi:VWFA-related protein
MPGLTNRLARAVCVGFLLAASPVATAVGQPTAETETTFAERLEIELVDVEVWAFERDGGPAYGLGAEDFEVLHDGRVVPLTHFRQVRPAVALSPAASPRESAPPAPGPLVEPIATSHLIAFFDQSGLEPGGHAAVAEGLAELLASGAIPPERVLILRHEGGLYLEAPFGSSAAEVEAALARLAGAGGSGVSTAAELQQVKLEVQEAWDESSGFGGTAGQGASQGGPQAGAGGTPREAVQRGRAETGIASPNCELFEQRVAPIVDGWARVRGARVAASLAGLAQVATFLGGVPGVKSLLYVGGGLDPEPGTSLVAYVSDFCLTRARSHRLESVASGLSRDLRSIGRHFATHRVTIHGVQGPDLQAPGAISASQRGLVGPVAGRLEASQRRADLRGLELLAEETGGRTLVGRDDLSAGLRDLARDLGSFYSLAYELPAGEGSSEHEIEVRAKRPFLVLRHRRGFREQRAGEDLEEGLAGALYLGITRNPLEVRLGMGETSPEESLVRLYVMVAGDRLVFAPGERGDRSRLVLRGLVRSAASPFADPVEVEREYRVRRPPGQTAERVDLPVELRLAPGAYQVALALRDEGSGETSFVTTSFDVGE